MNMSLSDLASLAVVAVASFSVAACAPPGVVAARDGDAAAASVNQTVLLKTTHAWDGTRYLAYPPGQPELTVVRYTIPAHAVLPWHMHPSINVGYVVSGHLSAVRRSDGKRIALGPGDVVPEMVDLSHRGETGSEAAELVVFYAGTTGTPLTVPDGDD
ncbi:cupin domain-containing protein [Burkholderia mayonis]|nr:cupin domain-containing protein [Burkholderia mayonis]